MANLGANVGIVRVKSREAVFEGVDVGKVESGFVEGADGIQYVEGPAALLGFERGKGLEFAEGAARFGGGDWPIVCHKKDPGIRRNLVQKNVAANPASTSRSGGERCSAFQRRERESEVRYEDEGRDHERVELIVQEKQVRRVALENGGAHLAVGTVGNSAAKSRGAAF